MEHGKSAKRRKPRKLCTGNATTTKYSGRYHCCRYIKEVNGKNIYRDTSINNRKNSKRTKTWFDKKCQEKR